MITSQASDFSQKWLKYQHDRHDHPEKYALISTGLKDLDTLLGGGIERGQLVLVGGAQKSGKTTLALRMCKAAALQGKKFIWFGAEMNNFQLGNMLFSNITGIERTKIRKIGLEMVDWQALEIAGKEIESYPGYFNYGFQTIEDMRKVVDAVELELGRRLDILFGDYLQLLEAPGIKGGRAQEIEAISRHAKRLTLREDPLAVVFATQLNRESIRGNLMDANSFLGSGSQERDMDLGMIIHDLDDPDHKGRKLPHQKEIVIVGSRETDVGSCTVYYNGATATIENAIPKGQDVEQYWS